MDTLNEFAVVSVEEKQRVAWPRIASVGAMVAFSLPTFITGLELYHDMTPVSAAWALLIGSVIIFIVGALMGVIGAITHMSSYLLVRIAFGDRGAGIVNVAFAVSLLGWFGVNINLFVDAVDGLSTTLFGGTLHPLIWTAIASFAMTATTLVGFKAINKLSVWLVPVLAIVTGLLIYHSAQLQGITGYLNSEASGSISLGDGISAVVGAIIIGAIILPDITRFARHWTGAIYTAFFAYIVVQLAVMGAAAFAGGATGETDIINLMVNIGLGAGAFIIIIAGSWVLNSLNLYSAVLGIKATFPKLPTMGLTIALGALGIAAGALNLLDQFITFIFYLSVIFVPVAGVLLVDFFLIRRAAYRIETLADNAALNVSAFVSWGVGAVFAVLMSEEIIPSITGMAVLDAAVLSALVYGPLSWRRRQHVPSEDVPS